MTSADSIVSRGRTKKVSALSIASHGRLYKGIIGEIVVVTIAEIMNLVSRVKTILNVESRIE